MARSKDGLEQAIREVQALKKNFGMMLEYREKLMK